MRPTMHQLVKNHAKRLANHVTTESLIQSRGVPETFLLDNGTTAELRRGCLVDSETRRVLTNSQTTTRFLLQHGLLSDEQLLHWAEFGPAICASAALSRLSGWGACA